MFLFKFSSISALRVEHSSVAWCCVCIFYCILYSQSFKLSPSCHHNKSSFISTSLAIYHSNIGIHNEGEIEHIRPKHLHIYVHYGNIAHAWKSRLYKGRLIVCKIWHVDVDNVGQNSKAIVLLMSRKSYNLEISPQGSRDHLSYIPATSSTIQSTLSAVIVCKMVGQDLFLDIILNNLMVGTGHK